MTKFFANDLHFVDHLADTAIGIRPQRTIIDLENNRGWQGRQCVSNLFQCTHRGCASTSHAIDRAECPWTETFVDAVITDEPCRFLFRIQWLETFEFDLRQFLQSNGIPSLGDRSIGGEIPLEIADAQKQFEYLRGKQPAVLIAVFVHREEISKSAKDIPLAENEPRSEDLRGEWAFTWRWMNFSGRCKSSCSGKSSMARM